MKEEKKLFKDWFDQEAIQMLAHQITAVYREFDTIQFQEHAAQNLQQLEMMDRVKQFSNALRECLPDNIPHALTIITKSLPDPMPNCENVTDGWLQWPVGQFIADYCIDYPNPAMDAMTELTQRFSSEFAVRPFLEKYSERIQKQLLELTHHKNPHVRRWCSEGIRPRLPWGKKLSSLIEDPSPIFPILVKLIDDPELYVRRSVANNLNDISKDHPKSVIQFCKKWANNTDHRKWIIKHALRSLIKDGNPEALELLGYSTPEKILAETKLSQSVINIGESILVELELKNLSTIDQEIMLDYVVHFVRQNNKVSEKVFKWKSFCLKAGENLNLTKNHPMKITTVRKLYPGTHKIEIQANGKILANNHFELRAPLKT